ncbi:MAG TPA: PEP-CTERM sorting domain-containing protein [Terriglobales bacterium]|nr:PEP-CTERM sorting domain-containing protein [Terriglobales bacterium]
MTLFGLAMAGALTLGASTAHASQIPFQGTVTLNQMGNSALNPAVNFAFSGLTVSSLPAGDTLNGAAVSILPTGSGFIVSGPITTSGTTSTASFSSSGGTINMGNAGTGTLSGNISFITISVNSLNPGDFSVNVGVSGLTITAGSSSILTSWAGSTKGIGTLQFNFVSGPQTLAALEGLGLPGNGFDSRLTDSLAGTIAVPEPASLALFGSGLLGLAFLFKRRLYTSDGLNLQA